MLNFRKTESYTRIQLENWLKTLDIEAEAVADVGGKKLPVKNRVNRWQVKRYDILDLPDFDLNKKWEVKEIYDIIFCLETFEFVFNPVQAMDNLYRILKDDSGILYISFHFLYPHHGKLKIDYLRYTRWGIERLFQETGFKDWQIFPRFYKKPEGAARVYKEENMGGIGNNRDQIHREQGYLVKVKK